MEEDGEREREKENFANRLKMSNCQYWEHLIVTCLSFFFLLIENIVTLLLILF